MEGTAPAWRLGKGGFVSDLLDRKPPAQQTPEQPPVGVSMKPESDALKLWGRSQLRCFPEEGWMGQAAQTLPGSAWFPSSLSHHLVGLP